MAQRNLVALIFTSLNLVPSLLFSSNPNQPLDRPYTLLNSEPFLLEKEYHRMIAGIHPRSYIFPRPCFSEVDSSNVCREGLGWMILDSLRQRRLRISPIGGYEYRFWAENVNAADFGVLTEGNSGALSFFLDARMFTESHENTYHASYDREFVEHQDAQASGTLAYSSYSRYRSNLSYDWSWGRLTVARDAAHWGPGLFTNLVFQQDAIPFNQLTFTTHLGPLSVQSLYGQLAANTDWETDTTSEAKSIYAHRYEWQAGQNLVLGISEQLILYKVGAPFAFVPIIPLFITKASEKERLNNGNIAGDVSYRLPGFGTVYSEFLIDDLQSPTALFNDAWSNKWAWMAGAHVIKDWGALQSGLILEFSRVEPWVYTHYIPHTAQTSHEDYPLGNPWGPNSLSLVGKAYIRSTDKYYLGIRMEALWKGTALGSSIEDSHLDTDRTTKIFLEGAPGARIILSPMASWRWRKINFSGQIDCWDMLRLVSGVQFEY